MASYGEGGSLIAQLLAQLQSAGSIATAKDVVIQRSKEVSQITLPDKMSCKEGADWLLKKDKQDETVVAVHHEIECYPLDGAVAFRDALDEIFGYVQGVNIPPTWFSPAKPPKMIGVPVSETEIRQVPWGRVEIPGVFGYLQTGLTVNPTPKFMITGETKQRHVETIKEIVAATQRRLANHSIYKGKAIRLDLSWMRGDPDDFDPSGHAPTFSIPTNTVREEELILSDETAVAIDLGLFTPIELSAQCRMMQTPLKRGVLMAGEYGTGKTLTAYVTAKKAVENGWTFVYLSDVNDLASGFKFARQYAPAVIFAEDVDRALGQDDRTVEMDAILNAFDGVDSKSAEVITVLTTNHLEKLTQAILRPGRCDTLVQLTRPNADAAGRLVKLYGRGLLSESADTHRLGVALEGHLPAEIREAVERAKLAAVRRLAKTSKLYGVGSLAGQVQEEDVLAAVKAMAAQHKLLEPKSRDNRTIPEKAADLLGDRIGNAIRVTGDKGLSVVLGLLQQTGFAQNDLYRGAYYLNNENDVPDLTEQLMGTTDSNGDTR